MTEELIEAAKAVIERWDSKDWKAAPTAEVMSRLRNALEELSRREAAKPAWCVCALGKISPRVCRRHSGSDDEYCLGEINGQECGHDRACHGGEV